MSAPCEPLTLADWVRKFRSLFSGNCELYTPIQRSPNGITVIW